MAPIDEATDEDKGAPIKFVKGMYVGEQGWVHKDKGYTLKMIYVVVEKSSKVLYTKWTRILQTSVKLVSELEEASSYEEAILQQHSDIDDVRACKMQDLNHHGRFR